MTIRPEQEAEPENRRVALAQLNKAKEKFAVFSVEEEQRLLKKFQPLREALRGPELAEMDAKMHALFEEWRCTLAQRIADDQARLLNPPKPLVTDPLEIHRIHIATLTEQELKLRKKMKDFEQRCESSIQQAKATMTPEQYTQFERDFRPECADAIAFMNRSLSRLVSQRGEAVARGPEKPLTGFVRPTGQP